MTRVAFYATHVQAEVLRRRDELAAAYERSPDATMYWAFVDLVGSSNFRLQQGLKEGFVRGEGFNELVTATIAPYGGLRRVKELGDGVLLVCSDLRPLWESCVLMGQVSHQIALVAGNERYPFAVRMAVGYGPAKRLADRPVDDFLGSPIDALSRLCGMAEPNELLLTEDAFQPNRHLLREYDAFAQHLGPQQAPEEASKGLLEPLLYRRVIVDRAALAVHETGFAEWAEAVETSGGSGPRA